MNNRLLEIDIMSITYCCPRCSSTNIKKNGHIDNGKQNHRCNDCHRAFVESPEHVVILEDKKEYIEKMLLERISLRGICRVRGL